MKKICIYGILFLFFSIRLIAYNDNEPKSSSINLTKEFIKSEVKRIRILENKKIILQSEFIEKSFFYQPVILQEGFETVIFPPAGWSSVIISGEPNWVQDFTAPYLGNASAYSSFGPAGTVSSRFLITKRIPVVGTYKYRLSFWIKREFTDVYAPDTVYVKLSNTDSLPSSFITTIYKCYTGVVTDTSTDPNIYTTNYRKFTVTFSGYSGFVWIAFDHQDDDGQGIFLDEVKVEEIVDNDIAPELITNPIANSRKNYNQSFNPKAVFKNYGLSNQSNISVKFQIVSPYETIIYNNIKSISFLAPDSIKEVEFDSFTPYIYGLHKARAIATHTGDQNIYNDTIEIEFSVPLNISGIRTVGNGGDHLTISDALEYLTLNNIADTITFLLINNEYNEPPLSISELYYASSPKPVILKPTVNINPIINIKPTVSEPYCIKFNGTRNFIIDGSNNFISKSRNLTFNLDTLGFFAPAILITNNSSNLEFKNFNIFGYTKSDLTTNTAIMIDSGGTNEASYSLLFSNIQIKRAFNGFFFNGSLTKKHTKILIEECDLGGDNIDRITQAGIVFYQCDSILVNRCNIQKLSIEIGLINLYGIYLGIGTNNSIISNNLIQNIINKSNGNYAVGIQNHSGPNSNLLCYNNMLYDIRSVGSGINENATYCFYSSNELNSDESYYYNSIYLSGIDSSSSSSSFSTGFYFVSGVNNIRVRNNSIYNNMDFINSSGFNKAYCMYIEGVNWLNNSVSNYNNFYAPGVKGAVGFINSVNRYNLYDWRTYTGQDANSVSSDPLYVSEQDLHIVKVGIKSPLDSTATPIDGINLDYDNDFRNLTHPDIGADEFDMIQGVIGQVNSGWNMISVPVHSDDNSVSAIFPNAISSAFMYSNGYIRSDTLNKGIGYWLKFSSNQNVYVSGVPVLDETLDVVTGWNMIGTISTPVLKTEIITIPANILSSEFYSYNNGYVRSDTLLPMKAYWIKTNQSGKIILKK